MNLVDWLKTMVSNRNTDGVLDPKLPEKPSSRALKRILLVALRCVDPNAQKRPKMGHVVHMLEAEDFPYRDVSLNSSSLNWKDVFFLQIAKCTWHFLLFFGHSIVFSHDMVVLLILVIILISPFDLVAVCFTGPEGWKGARTTSSSR